MVVILQVNRETKNVHKTDIPVPAKFINILDYLRKIWWQRFCLIIKYSSRHGTKYETISSYNYVHTCILGHLPLVRNTGVLWHLLTPPTPARLMLAFELRDAQAPPLINIRTFILLEEEKAGEYRVAVDRRGVEQKIPLLGISIAVSPNINSLSSITASCRGASG